MFRTKNDTSEPFCDCQLPVFMSVFTYGIINPYFSLNSEIIISKSKVLPSIKYVNVKLNQGDFTIFYMKKQNGCVVSLGDFQHFHCSRDSESKIAPGKGNPRHINQAMGMPYRI